MSVVLWVLPIDCDPPHGLDMTTKHDSDKVQMLVEGFVKHGFDKTKPALVGYPRDGRIQLLSGTHRHEASTFVPGMKLPVVLWLGSIIEESWGRLEKWRRVMEDVSVFDLENWTRGDIEKAYQDQVGVRHLAKSFDFMKNWTDVAKSIVARRGRS